MTEPVLDAEERALLARGVDEFNRGYFFECHDTLEEMWSGLRGPARDFFQGLIQVAVGFYHLSNGNTAGAHSMFGRALKRWAGYPDRYCGFDLAAYRKAVADWRARAAAAEVPFVLDPAAVPPWRFG